MKILVTGGAGYIGNELVYQLAKDERVSQVIIYDNLVKKHYNLFTGSRKMNPDKVRFMHADILDGRTLRKALDGIDTVYHLAANVTTPFAHQNPQFFEQVNHWGTAELVNAIEESKVKKVIYLSSVSVYGSQVETVSINTSLNPRTYYGISKKRGEDQINRLSRSKETFIIRSGNVYGYSKHMRIDAVINRFMFESHFENRITVQGNGQQHRSFIAIERVIDALVNLPFSTLETGVYNLSDKNLSILELAETLKALYPELEMLFVNQHLNMREIKVDTDHRLDHLFSTKQNVLRDDLLAFREYFTF